jgi:hypothetical protein
VLRGPDPTYSTTSGGGCSIFLPGRYASKPHLGAHNYFASGIYYFENVDTIDVNGVDVSGGNPGTETSLVSVHPCATDDAAGVSDGSGVEWILGGTSAVSVGSALGTSFELFARQPAASALEGAAGISIRGVPAVAPGYMPSSSNVFSNVGGNSSELSVHGLVYAPDADIVVSGTISIGSELSGGVVAKTLRLDPKGVATGGFGIVSSVGPPADRQLFTISSTASQGGGTKNVKTTAVIELKNDLNRSVVIDSWTTNLLTNPA